MTKHSDVFGLLGLARRANKLVIGDDASVDLIRAGQARAVLIANDAGENIVKKIRRLAEESNLPVLTLPGDKTMLGNALGRSSCAVCSLSDTGFAASAAKKLVSVSQENALAAQLLDKKHARMLERRAKPRKDGAGRKLKEKDYIDIEEEDYKRRFGKEK